MALLKIRIPVLLLAALLLGACGPGLYRWEQGHEDPQTAESYDVRKGDTLYSIAWRYGLDYRELARWNGIGSNFLIYPGQQLRLTPPIGAVTESVAVSTTSGETDTRTVPARADQPSEVVTPMPPRPMPRGAWQWPARGALLAGFGDANATGKGIAIGGSEGDPIMASADGRVVYAGSGLIGYGKIIIVKHSEEYLSAYGHNDTIYVREGEQVKQGDRIATMGRGPGNKPLLHFEIRIKGEAVDPLAHLPPR